MCGKTLTLAGDSWHHHKYERAYSEDEEGRVFCRACTEALDRPASDGDRGATLQPATRRLNARHCVYCGRASRGLEPDGPGKYCCTDQVACERRIRDGLTSGSVPEFASAVSPPAAVTERSGDTRAACASSPPLHFGESLRLPLAAAQARYVLLGKSGCGKTNGDTVIVEEIFPTGAPVIIFDVLGNMSGLRSSSDGMAPGLPIPILGGRHGDLPLHLGDGASIAELVAHKGLSVILDVSQISRDDQQGFAADFFPRLVPCATKPFHVIIEEVDTFAPARLTTKSQARSHTALTVFARQCRNDGHGWTCSTQRPQLLAHDIISSSSAFLAMLMTGDGAQDAIGAEARTRIGKHRAKAILESLGQLRRGEAWLLTDPAWLDDDDAESEPIRFTFRWRNTFDTSRRPKIGEIRPEATVRAEVDVSEFEALLDAKVAVPGVTLDDDDDDANKDALSEAQRRHDAIAPLLNDGGRDVVVARGRELGISPATLYRWLGAYREQGAAVGLIPKTGGWPTGRSRLDPSVERVIEETIRRHSLTPQRLRIAHVARQVALECHKRGLPEPHYNAVARRIHAIPENERLRARGPRELAARPEVSARAESVTLSADGREALAEDGALDPESVLALRVHLDDLERLFQEHDAVDAPGEILRSWFNTLPEAHQNCLITAMVDGVDAALERASAPATSTGVKTRAGVLADSCVGQRILLALARSRANVWTRADLVKRCNLSANVVIRTLSALRDLRYVTMRRGQGGGVTLTPLGLRHASDAWPDKSATGE